MGKPVVSTVDVPQPRTQVWDFLDVLANHEQFTDHMLADWEIAPGAPSSGVGAKASVTGRPGGQRAEIEVLEVEPGRRSVERATAAGGRRVTQGVYELDDLPDGGTRVTFTFELVALPPAERLLAPLVRRIVGRGNARAMERLAYSLASSVPA